MKFLLIAAFLVYAFLSFGCGKSPNPSQISPVMNGDDTITGTADYTLEIADTVSLDLQADYGIFAVDDISAASDGYIALLDGTTAQVTVIDPSGNADNVGGLGNGPGEFQSPRAIAVSDEGSLAVSDFIGGFIRVYDPALESYIDIDGFIMANPGRMFLLDSGDIVGMRIMFTSNDGEPSIGHQTALWKGTDPEPAVVYLEEMHTFTLNDFGWSLIAPYPMTCSPDGAVYTSPVSTEEYVIDAFAPDGTVLWSVERPLRRTQKSQEEMDIEKSTVTRLMQQSEHQAEYTPDPYNYAVSDLGLGPDGNLWALRPGAAGSFFDVYDASTGEFLFSVSTLSSYELLRVTPAGILAIPPGDTQSLLMLDLAPAQTPPE